MILVEANSAIRAMCRAAKAVAWPLLICATFSVCAAAGIEERIFAEGAHWHGQDYIKARDTLAAQGVRLLPFVRERLRSDDWRERLFAAVLELRIEHPDQLAGWRKAVLQPFADRRMSESLRKDPIDSDLLPVEGAQVPVPFLVDLLWQDGAAGSAGEVEHLAVALQFAISAPAEMAEAMLEAAGKQHRLRGPVRHGLIKLGKAALPLARLTVAAPALPLPPARGSSLTQEEREARQQYWIAAHRADIAADVIWTAGDTDSIPLLVRQLRKGGYGRKELYSGQRDYVEALAHALVRLNAVEGVDAILDQAFAAARLARRNSRAQELYGGLRHCVVSFGTAALPTLGRRSEAGQDAMERMLLASLVAEVSGTGGEAREAAALRESLWFDPRPAGFLRSHELTGEDVFGELVELTRSRRRMRGGAWLALGELRDPRAIPLLVSEVKDAHAQLQRELAHRRRPDTASLDSRAAREAAYTFDPKLGEILRRGDLALLVLLRVGGDEARRALYELRAFPEYELRVGTFLLLLDGNVQGVAARLEDADRAVREEAALALHEVRHPRGTLELLRASARRRGPAHEEWRARVLASPQDVRPILQEALQAGEVRERVLAEALLLELEQADKVNGFRETLRAAAHSVGMMHVIRIGMLESAGRRMARRPDDSHPAEARERQGLRRPGDRTGALDESHIPLLEAACMFGQGIMSRGIAAFALAEFAKPRSMEVLASSFDMGSLGVSNPAALALASFGEAGARLAAKAPAPTPGEFDTGMRMTSHRGGVRVLAETQDARGADEIIKGLRALAQDRTLDRWERRLAVYLDAAGKCDDKRLIDPLLRILDTGDRPERYSHAKVIGLLSAYEDARLLPRFVRSLAKSSEQSVRTAAVTGITRRLGHETPQFLIAQLRRVKDVGIRGRLLVALGELSYAEQPAYPGKAEWSREKLRTSEQRMTAASHCRTLAYPVLVAALGDASSELSEMAAKGLTILASGNQFGEKPNEAAVKPLTEWCRTRQQCFWQLAGYLAQHGNEETGRVLLEILRSRAAGADDNGMVFALGRLRTHGGVPVLLRNLRAYAAKRKRFYGTPAHVTALAQYGDTGAQAILTFFTDFDHMLYRVDCAKHLAELEYRPAAAPLAAYLREVIQAGPTNPNLVMGSGEGHLTREQVLLARCRALFRALDQLDAGETKAIAGEVLLDGPAEVAPAAVEVWRARTE